MTINTSKLKPILIPKGDFQYSNIMSFVEIHSGSIANIHYLDVKDSKYGTERIKTCMLDITQKSWLRSYMGEVFAYGVTNKSKIFSIKIISKGNN